MVLENATQLRDKITANDFDRPSFKCSSEVVRLDLGMEIQEALEDAYSISQVEGTVVICRSNKRANLYNQQIRALIRGLENDISTGDFLMIVRNNYYWLPEGSKAGFIANGDMVEVMRIYEINELYDYKFARISVRLIDYPNEEYFECIVFLDTLKSLDRVQLSFTVAQVLNFNRQKTSTLGFKVANNETPLEARNIMG